MTALLDLYDEVPTAIEKDLIRHGLRWRDLPSDEFTWRDLKVIIEEADADSAFVRAKYPDAYNSQAHWAEYLAYILNIANVQRGNQSHAKRGDFPEAPSWMTQEKEADHFGSAPLNSDDMAAFLGGAFLL